MQRIPLSEPYLAGNEWTYVKECLDTNWVSYAGRFVKLFEERFAAAVGVKHGVACSSGTAALHLAAVVAGIQPGDLVLVPSLTFIATANAVRYCGADPVFLDVDAATWNLDPARVSEYLEEQCARRDGGTFDRGSGRRVRGMIPVHLYGHPAPMPELMELAARHGLLVIEDATESLGARVAGRGVGTFGQMSCFSFNGNKLITTGGGGMVVCDDDRLAERLRFLSTQARSDSKRYFHPEIGYNYRMGNIQAALGVAQLEQIGGFLERKKRTAALYARLLEKTPELEAYRDPPGVEGTYWLNAVLTAGQAERDRLLQGLEAEGVEARAFFVPLHTLPPYESSPRGSTAVTERLHARGINLPSSSSITDGQVERVAEILMRLARSAPAS